MVGVFDLPHFRDQVGGIQQFRWRVAPRNHHVQFRGSLPQGPQHGFQRQQTVGHDDVQLIQDEQVDITPLQDTSRYLYPPRQAHHSQWRAQVADELQLLARGLPRGKVSRSLNRKALSMRHCGSVTKVRQCTCGAHRPGSGVLSAPTPLDHEHPMFCTTRACPICARRAAQTVRHELAGVIKRVKPVDGYRWRHGTLTTQYDPSLEDDLTVEALRERAKGLQHAAKAMWSAELRQPGAGLYWALEIASGGFVHLHFLHFGPFIPKHKVEQVAHAAYERCGFTWIEEVKEETQEALVLAILEVGKYTAKGPSPQSEWWIADEFAREVLHPVLAARWEAAVHAMHTHQRLGAFRVSKEERLRAQEESDTEKSVEQRDKDEACPACGVVGEWTWVARRTDEWLHECHARGERGLAGSRWGGRTEREAAAVAERRRSAA